MTEPLYRKVMKGKKTTYELYKPDETVVHLTDAQIITLVGMVGTGLLIFLENLYPPHKRLAVKIKKVHEAILDLFKGTGTELPVDMAETAMEAVKCAIRYMEGGTQK